MSDKPIIMSAPMVRALLAGRKTQTRQIIKPQPEMQDNGRWHLRGCGGGLVNVAQQDIGDHLPDYVPWSDGDRLWVREAWRPGFDADGYRENLQRVARPSDYDPATTAIEYLADGMRELSGKDRPSIHMPRWASRLTLVVTDVRVQRLQDIDQNDAISEGVLVERIETQGAPEATGRPPLGLSPRERFRELWTSLHGADAWAANPWVAALTFSVHRRNIDATPSPTPASRMEARHG